MIAQRSMLHDRFWAWWLGRIPGRERIVLSAAVTIRIAGIVTLAYVLPMVWSRLPRPGLSLALAVGLAAESVLMIGWWVKRRRLVAATLWVDLLVSAVALIIGAALTERAGAIGWVLFAYPYVILISFAFGLACRTLVGALICGVVAAAAGIVGLALFHPAPTGNLILVVPTYLVNPLVGWGCARLLRRAANALEEARSAAVRETADLVTAKHRARLSTALHDRVLQTLDTLGRGGVIADDAMRQRVAVQAAWLRRYVETGEVDQSEDLSVGLEAAARAANLAGLEVEVCDARLRGVDPSAGLVSEQREALIEATHQAIAAFGSADGHIVVRAVPEGNGVLITVLSTGRMVPDPDDIADARARLASVGGRLTVDSAPFAALWMPAHRGTEAGSEPAASGRAVTA